MKRSLWDKRIPSIFAFLIIALGIGLTSFLAQTGIISFLKAAPSETPVGVRVSNITDSSFTVSYTTEANVQGTCILKNSQNTAQQILLDERDTQTGIPTSHYIHSFSAKDLLPKSQYTFTILSGNTKFLNNNKPFSTATGSTIINSPKPRDPVIGKIILPSSDNPPEAIVYLTAIGSQTISAIVKPNGTYFIPLTGLRDESLNSYINFDKIINLQMLAQTQDMSSQITASLKNSNPLPLITLTNDYDFTINTNPLPTSSDPTAGFPIFFNQNTKATAEIDIPSQNQNFVDNKPLLRGKALPNSTVQITIHSTSAIYDQVTTDAYGNWLYRPKGALSPGKHTISINVKDQFGVIQTIQQAFNVFESGSQVAEAATPSATTTPPTPTIPTPTPTPTAIPTPTSTLTPTPTQVVSPTTIPPTATPTQTIIIVTPTPTPGKSLLPTGNNSVITTAVTGIITTIVGIGILLLTRGQSL